MWSRNWSSSSVVLMVGGLMYATSLSLPSLSFSFTVAILSTCPKQAVQGCVMILGCSVPLVCKRLEPTD